MGDISFGTNLFKPNGAENLGISKERSTPNSHALKNPLLLPGCVDVLKNEPVKENLNNSAPLNEFLFVTESLPEKPSFLMLECVSSVSAPIEYFFCGVNLIFAINNESLIVW